LGGGQYLARLAGAAISPAAARDYARLIVEMACRRALTERATEALQALSAGGDSPEVKMALLHALHALPEASGEETTFSIGKAMMALRSTGR
jgi:replicative DNA helicase